MIRLTKKYIIVIAIFSIFGRSIAQKCVKTTILTKAQKLNFCDGSLGRLRSWPPQPQRFILWSKANVLLFPA